MKFSSLVILGGLFALSSANHTQYVDVVCTDPAPATVTQTITVTAGGNGGYNGGNNNQITTTVNQPPYIVTNGPSITSVEYDGTKTSVWVYPTGSTSHDCIVAVYEETTIITVIVVNIDITITNNQPTTATSTVHDQQPTSTPGLPPIASTTTTTSAPTTWGSSPSHTSNPTVHNVIVGADGELKYGPRTLDARIGDIIRFDFNSTNHTVTQSTFDSPCTPLEGGFNTGFNQFNPTNHTGLIFRDFEVKASTPLWFYCAQTVKTFHCHKGMVLGVNPGNKFPEFLNKATSTQASSITSAGPTATGTGGIPIWTGTKGTSSASSSTSAPFPIGTGGINPSYTGSSLLSKPSGGYIPKRAAAFVA
jgi:plastocyanin